MTQDWGNTKNFSFCIFSRTEELLKNPRHLHLLQSFFSPAAFDQYRAPVDLLFCEIFSEWKEPCFRFYDAKGGRLYSYPEASPKQLLKWDLYLSETALPRLKELFLKGRRRWASVLPELKMPQPPPVRAAQSESFKGLPTSLGIHKACSEALEIARLRGQLCRIVHELVEAVRFQDELWFEESLKKTKNFIESLAPDKFGAQMASKILIERIHYVEQLPQYVNLRIRFLDMLQRARISSSNSALLMSRNFKQPADSMSFFA